MKDAQQKKLREKRKKDKKRKTKGKLQLQERIYNEQAHKQRLNQKRRDRIKKYNSQTKTNRSVGRVFMTESNDQNPREKRTKNSHFTPSLNKTQQIKERGFWKNIVTENQGHIREYRVRTFLPFPFGNACF